MFINARTDVYLAGLVAPEQLLAETLHRAHRTSKQEQMGSSYPELATPHDQGAVEAIERPAERDGLSRLPEHRAALRTRSGPCERRLGHGAGCVRDCSIGRYRAADCLARMGP